MGVDSTAMVLVWAMAAMAMVALATDMARGPLMLRPSPRPMLTSGMVDSTAMVLVWAMAAMAMEVLVTTARGPLWPSLRPMPTWDMVDSTATVLVWAMAAMAMEVLATDTARGPLMPKPMPTLDMVAFMATVLVWAMAASTATDSQPMAVTATDCGARSKQNQIPRLTISYNTPNDLTGLYKHP